jgi:hypothetical protein
VIVTGWSSFLVGVPDITPLSDIEMPFVNWGLAVKVNGDAKVPFI